MKTGDEAYFMYKKKNNGRWKLFGVFKSKEDAIVQAYRVAGEHFWKRDALVLVKQSVISFEDIRKDFISQKEEYSNGKQKQ